MGGLIQPNPTVEERETNWRAIGIAVGTVVVIVAILWLVSRSEQKVPTGPPPYAANIKFSDLKMSAAENFVGARSGKRSPCACYGRVAPTPKQSTWVCRRWGRGRASRSA